MAKRKRQRFAFGWFSIVLRVLLLVLLVLWGLILWQMLGR
ncbi:hypothetical protein DEIPH_ctg041orf0022 [Deinococcus phoenicis]|uniref:Uncharacterized protein n=1 Tax=Deinococcus phoenicis TaxID=1476583 RepID=A0A016QMX5_9DEIO|nr:hypothetical protein DEIPH_ctg041orf0022 [Deinococcus phoenicis]